MPRLIEADALKRLRHDYIQGRIKFDGNEYDLIDKCPTIEAEPVRHGRWEEYPDSAHRRCTNCKKEFEKAKFSILALRCPICGAIMDGGEKSEANY